VERRVSSGTFHGSIIADIAEIGRLGPGDDAYRSRLRWIAAARIGTRASVGRPDHRPERQRRADQLRRVEVRHVRPHESLAKEAAFALKKAGKRDPHGVGITVNAVAPGFIETEMLATVPEKVLDGIRSNVPIGRLGRPEEIARVVHFLAADASSYITGQVWAVNGGQDM
jgi:NAD(P)-dependent dehydrogenase (short-subunit alcohol dehydrogenase family)